MVKSKREIDSGCFGIAFKDALQHANGDFFRPWQSLDSLVEASNYINGSSSAVSDHQRNSVLKLTFNILLTMGHRDLAYRVLEEIEEEIDKQEGLFLEIAIEDADYICRRLLSMHMPAEANRVASKYIQKIERRLECSFDPLLDEGLLKDILERLADIRKRAAIATLNYEDTRKKVEAILDRKQTLQIVSSNQSADDSASGDL